VNYIPAKERARIRSGAAQYEAATLARQTKEYLARKLARKQPPQIE